MAKVAGNIQCKRQTKYPGVREVAKGRYEVSFYAVKGSWKKTYRTVEAKTDKEASDKRLELWLESRKQWQNTEDDVVRMAAGFGDAWVALEKNICAGDLCKKARHHYKKTFDRMFVYFRQKEYPDLVRMNQLRLHFFERYKDYYCGTADGCLGRPGGWRSELIFVKAIMQRLYRLGYCSEEIIKKLGELKRPRPSKKAYPEISSAKLRKILEDIKVQHPDIYRVVRFISMTGRRIEETTLIEKKDVSWAGNRPIKLDIRAETTKASISAPIETLNDELEALIVEAFNDSSKHKAPFLFLNSRGKKSDQRTIRKYLKLYSKQVLGYPVTPHFFRHRLCVECGKRQVQIQDIMAMTGIKDIKVLVQYYSHSTREGQLKVLEVGRF